MIYKAGLAILVLSLFMAVACGDQQYAKETGGTQTENTAPSGVFGNWTHKCLKLSYVGKNDEVTVTVFLDGKQMGTKKLTASSPVWNFSYVDGSTSAAGALVFSPATASKKAELAGSNLEGSCSSKPFTYNGSIATW